MGKKFARVLLTLVVVVVVLALVLASAGVVITRRSFPQTAGEIQVPGLEAAVDVLRDEWGVPHIYAENSHDLFFAQGYVHAQDRFWQMDFWRHIGAGRLSELFGETQLESDRFLRTFGWARVAAQELEQLQPDSLAILEAYAQGVNAYLAERQGNALSLEYAVLKLTNADYEPEPWQPLHTLTWGKVMAWELSARMDEYGRTALQAALSPEEVADLFPPYPGDHPVIVSGFGTFEGESSLPDLDPVLLSRVAPGLAVLARPPAALEELVGSQGAAIGSNSWAIAGERTATGVPILANDPHLAIQMPAIWYEVGLHCTVQGPECAYQVAGVSFAGVPGVVIGHNERIAWGLTNTGPDVQDVYVEKINPDNPDQYEVNGQWVDMERVEETIAVAGGEPVSLTVRLTRHGPLVWEDSLEEFRAQAGIELPDRYGLALRWTALEPGFVFPAIWRFNLAQNWDEFRQAASLFDVPAQNLVYADVEGNIGYQMPGRIPIRSEEHSGLLPVPGWTDEYEWQGYVPFAELPHMLNPPEGYIVTANNAVVGPDYPYPISRSWDYGYRARRIVDLIEAAPGPIDLAYVQQMQADALNLNAMALLPALLELPLEDDRLVEARELLAGWDGQQQAGSAAAALFEAFWQNLLAVTFHDDLAEDDWPARGSRWFVVVAGLMGQPQSAWWDDAHTAEVETRDQILTRALGAAVDELEASQGKDPAGWAWGKLHTVTFRNQSLGESGIAPIEALFNRGPYETSGSESVVNATGWSTLAPYEVTALPSMRMIVNLADLAGSLLIHTTGQSGHAFHRHYVDMSKPWSEVEYAPLLWERSQVETEAEGQLRLVPAAPAD
jgi:penicillin amidase